MVDRVTNGFGRDARLRRPADARTRSTAVAEFIVHVGRRRGRERPPVILALHAAGEIDPWTAWALDPLVPIGAAAVALLYAGGVAAAARAGAGPDLANGRRAAAFAAGLVVIVLRARLPAATTSARSTCCRRT